MGQIFSSVQRKNKRKPPVFSLIIFFNSTSLTHCSALLFPNTSTFNFRFPHSSKSSLQTWCAYMSYIYYLDYICFLHTSTPSLIIQANTLSPPLSLLDHNKLFPYPLLQIFHSLCFECMVGYVSFNFQSIFHVPEYIYKLHYTLQCTIVKGKVRQAGLNLLLGNSRAVFLFQ